MAMVRSYPSGDSALLENAAPALFTSPLSPFGAASCTASTSSRTLPEIRGLRLRPGTGRAVTNQRHADLGSVEGVQAWRDMVITAAERVQARAAAPSARSAANSPRATRRPGP